MSPEQASGKPVDHRPDQFSFGLILYEMASGKKAFDKPEAVQTISAILTEEPPPVERSVPGPLRWTIDRCLSKAPADRYASSRDLYQELRYLRDHFSEVSATQAAASDAVPSEAASVLRQPSFFWLAAGAAIVLLAGILIGVVLTRYF